MTQFTENYSRYHCAVLFQPHTPMPNARSLQKKNCTWKILLKAAMEFAENYVLGNDVGEAAWAQWTEKANSIGAEELIALYNSQYQKYLK